MIFKAIMSKGNIGNIFSCDNIDEFVKSIKQVLHYRGYSESKFFLCEMNGVEFLTKLSFYKKTTPEIYSTENISNKDLIAVNPHDAEIGVLRILKKRIIDDNISPCVLELVYCVKCSNISKIVPDQADCDKYLNEKPSKNIKEVVHNMFCKHNDLVKHGLAHIKFSFLVLEECDITFHDFMLKYIEDNPINYEIFRSLMFQIIYTIYAITHIYPEFRHADLHTENVMLKFDVDYKYDPMNGKFLLFYVDGVKYYIPYFGIICKVIDFGFASIPEENIVSFASEDKQIMFMRTKNDLLFFMYDIFDTAGKNPSIGDFLMEIEPNETFKHYNTSYISRNESKIPSYTQMIQNKVFNVYKRTNVPQDHIHHEYASDY